MSIAKTIVKNTTMLLIADIISKVLSFFLIVFIARYLGAVGLGKYSFVFAFVGLFAIFSDFGISILLTREVAKDKTKTKLYFENIVTLKFILVLFAAVLPLIAIWFIDKSMDVKIAVYIVAIAMFFFNYEETFSSLIKAYEKMEYISLIIVLERIIIAGLGIYLLMMGFKLVALVLVFLLSYLVTFIIYYTIITRKITKFKFRVDLDFWKSILKQSLPFWFTALFITIYFRIDTVMLAMMKGYQAVGWYSASYKTLDALYFIPSAIIMAVFPVMSRLHVENKEWLSKLFKKAFYYLFSIGLPIGIGATLLASRIIMFVYKEEFTNSAIALQILIWAEVFIFISSVSGYLLNSIDKQRLFSYVTGFCAALNIVLNFILIPKYSYIGASIATVITEFFVFALLFYFVSKSGHGFNLFRLMVKPAIAGSIMALGIIYFGYLHLLLLIPLAAIIYFSFLFIVKGIGREEIEMVKGLVKRE